MEKKILPVPCAVITNDAGEIYMQRRHDPESPAHGKWELPGGGLEFGESPDQTVLREVKEETNLDVEIVRLLPKIYTNIWPEAQVLLIAYHCKLLPGSGEAKHQEIEVSEARFFKPEEIDFSNSLPLCKEIIDLLNS